MQNSGVLFCIHDSLSHCIVACSQISQDTRRNCSNTGSLRFRQHYSYNRKRLLSPYHRVTHHKRKPIQNLKRWSIEPTRSATAESSKLVWDEQPECLNMPLAFLVTRAPTHTHEADTKPVYKTHAVYKGHIPVWFYPYQNRYNQPNRNIFYTSGRAFYSKCCYFLVIYIYNKNCHIKYKKQNDYIPAFCTRQIKKKAF